jgi:hypothetical protein
MFTSVWQEYSKNVHYTQNNSEWFINIFRNDQEGSVTVDNGTAVTKRSPGKLRQLNTNTGLYIGNKQHPGNDTLAK